MTVRVGINGFGRIGRSYLRAAMKKGADIEVVAVNDLAAPEANAHLLAYDSTQGRLGEKVSVEGNGIRIGDRVMPILAERDPASISWGDLGADVVVESTGRFTTRESAAAHLKGGAKRVVVSAPATGVDATFVVGVNDADFDPDLHEVVSNASCTTNCVVPMAKVMDDAFGIKQGLMTTVHAYTNDQNVLDLVHKDLRRARAAAVNVVPASTGAARATGLVLSHLKGRLDGVGLRVPVPVGSITDLVVVVEAEVDKDGVNEAFAKAAGSGQLSRVLDYSDAPLVSSDIVGSPASCTFDSGLTMAMPLGNGTTLAKIFGWYDNEWGYSNRLVDLTLVVGGAA
ncbi:MAG: type I glyceraldehyde-3-phosphate dehydrogenase [Actinomycetota bacterium]|nr:type I glyceraldehyde-3-phosphate dehydrogenase [Actinomycetota bacterium]